ncbi:hypothetical protein J2Y63_006569 [Shinella sp. BE166]|uniref:hypothetical protein n=1 Tax=Shinella sp. BE166 TaxID=3373918 RepID=UPI003EB73D88
MSGSIQTADFLVQGIELLSLEEIRTPDGRQRFLTDSDKNSTVTFHHGMNHTGFAGGHLV